MWALDLSRSDVEDYLVSLFDTIINVWGYRYLKPDFYAGLMQGVFSKERVGLAELCAHYGAYPRVFRLPMASL